VLDNQCSSDTPHRRHSIYLQMEEWYHYFKVTNGGEVTHMKECEKITF
jgi:hypothetical protein